MEEDPFSELYRTVKEARGEDFARKAAHGYKDKPMNAIQEDFRDARDYLRAAEDEGYNNGDYQAALEALGAVIAKARRLQKDMTQLQRTYPS